MASILVDTSMANIMSMPSTSESFQLLYDCGLASTTTIMVKHKARRANGSHIKRCLSDFGAF